MSYYSRLRLVVESSLYSDYSSPDLYQALVTNTPSMWEVGKLVSIGTGGTEAIDTIVSYSAGVKALVIHNTDATNYVTLIWQSAANPGNDNKVRIRAGQVFVTTDVTQTVNPTLQANTNACLVRITVLGT